MAEPLYYDMIAGTNPDTDVHMVWCRARYADHLEIEAGFDATQPGEVLKAARWGIRHGVTWPQSCDPERAAQVLANAFKDHMAKDYCKHGHPEMRRTRRAARWPRETEKTASLIPGFEPPQTQGGNVTKNVASGHDLVAIQVGNVAGKKAPDLRPEPPADPEPGATVVNIRTDNATVGRQADAITGGLTIGE